MAIIKNKKDGKEDEKNKFSNAFTAGKKKNEIPKKFQWERREYFFPQKISILKNTKVSFKNEEP